jgi:hypothetical protein
MSMSMDFNTAKFYHVPNPRAFLLIIGVEL